MQEEIFNETSLKYTFAYRTKEKPFNLWQMQETFFWKKPYLKTHLLIHTPENLYPCDVCIEEFSEKFSLNGYLCSHT